MRILAYLAVLCIELCMIPLIIVGCGLLCVAFLLAVAIEPLQDRAHG